MAYDLHLTGPAEARAAAARLAHKHGCEAHAGDTALHLSLTAGDEAVARLYRALVKRAHDAGAALYDPQAGVQVNLDTPGRYPPAFVPSGPVAGATYKAKVKAFLTDHLGPHGFALRDAHTAVRPAEHQTQGVHFVPGTGARAGHFSVSLYRTFNFKPLVDPTQMDGVQRLERLVRAHRPTWIPEHGWLPTTPTRNVDRAFAHLQTLFTDTIHPLFDDTRTLEGLVDAFESNRLTADEAFGPGAENLAQAYRHLGRLPEGQARYEAILASLATHPDPQTAAWANTERQLARRFFEG